MSWNVGHPAIARHGTGESLGLGFLMCIPNLDSECPQFGLRVAPTEEASMVVHPSRILSKHPLFSLLLASSSSQSFLGVPLSEFSSRQISISCHPAAAS